MADVIIVPYDAQAGSSATTAYIWCNGVVSDTHETSQFDVEVNFSDNATQINTKIVDRAIEVFGQLGITIGVGDVKRIVGAAT